ncbi:hypothetical protein NC651_038209 [Populus alba x Populus x berolinensis]|nr:hypothetical protein NC651_038209 [Populus alba x Populus x berolinensis]
MTFYCPATTAVRMPLMQVSCFESDIPRTHHSQERSAMQV